MAPLSNASPAASSRVRPSWRYATDVLDQIEARVPARDEQPEVRKRDRTIEEDREQVALEVVDADEGQAALERDPLRDLQADEQRADETRAVGRRHGLDVVERRPRRRRARARSRAGSRPCAGATRARARCRRTCRAPCPATRRSTRARRRRRGRRPRCRHRRSRSPTLASISRPSPGASLSRCGAAVRASAAARLPGPRVERAPVGRLGLRRLALVGDSFPRSSSTRLRQ